MEAKSKEETILLPHHEQQSLCTNRLPYRQGRKLTAVKVYTINNESRHLLVFGVPSLNLRQEAKALFSKFGKLHTFHIDDKYKKEMFTETYHAAFERIQSARVAKRMLDTKNFYGGSLHICYAPEFETIDDTRQKLEQRRKDVNYRLVKLKKEKEIVEDVKETVQTDLNSEKRETLNMADINVITVGPSARVLKRRCYDVKNDEIKHFKPCFIEKEAQIKSVDVIDATSVDKEVITNVEVDKTLNYNNFGNEVIRKVPIKPLNTIKFNFKNT